MNLKKVGSYSIGLDLGTNSVGWAVVDENGDLCRKGGKSTWGSRLFSAGNPASEARLPRGQRRRYIRRRWRINLLQGFFAEEMEKVDPTFFIRLNQSRLLSEDKSEDIKGCQWPLFNGSDFTEVDYYKQFPTIFHLRQHLMTSDEKADIRLVYLALHNIVKYRGNFLQEDNTSLSAAHADIDTQVNALVEALEKWCEELEVSCAIDAEGVANTLRDKSLRRAEVAESLLACLSIGKSDIADGKVLAKTLSRAVVGYEVDMSKIFPGIEADQPKFKLSDDEKPDAFEESCADVENAAALFDAMRSLYSAFVLMGILVKPGLSASKIAAYEQYGEDLAVLKSLVREYAPSSYDAFFRGPVYGESSNYDVSKAKGYTRYNLGVNKKGSGAKPMSYEDFAKEVKKLLSGTNAISDPRYVQMISAFEEERFLRRLRTSDNGQIPFQLHLEEMTSIIEKQSAFYPFLEQGKEKLEKLVSFRIPYYVGPLTQVNAAKEGDSLRFAWSTRKEGMENERIYPWNWDQVIDKHASAEAFIHRMTGTCTYLEGEPVLPKCSLLYEEFCVLNELNGAKWTQDGDRDHRFNYEDRMGVFESLFCKKRSVKYSDVAEWMWRNHGWTHVHVHGGQGETGFESKMASHIFFCKDVFGTSEFPEEHRQMAETIILWNTLFEDRSILREKISIAYGDILSDEQIKTICKKRFSGWGRLSKKLLTGITMNTDCGPRAVMDVMREGDPNNAFPGRAMVFMEVLSDDRFGIKRIIDDCNEKKKGEGCLTQVNELPGSPANRRTINQALRIVDEVVSIAGHAPDCIFVEETRNDDMRAKGKRTTSRYRNIQQALDSVRNQFGAVSDELKHFDPKELDDDRLALYFMQGGKSLYSGKVLRIEDLSSYQIDHIIPQSYVKDDSLENRALVLPGENQTKGDNLLISESIRSRMAGYWRTLHDAGLIGDKKFKNLMCASISEGRMKGFIARQIVETSQIVKTTQNLLRERYPQSDVVPVRASLSHDLREACGFVKCREINDFHHAHDAYIACQMGRFIQKRHGSIYDNPIGMSHVLRGFVKEQSKQLKTTGKVPGKSVFLVQSFMKSGFDKETGEVFKDDWNAEAEIARIRKCLNYRDCFVVRMPEETTGSFWDQTVYSPRITKKRIPLKQNLNPDVYGGYSGETPAYFFIFKALKKGKPTYFFEGVPLTLSAKVSNDGRALVDLAWRITGPKYESVEILRPKVLKYQKIEFEGDEYYLAALGEVRIARQLWLCDAMTKAVYNLFENDAKNVDFDCLFDELVGKASIISSRSTAVIDSVLSRKDCFVTTSVEAKETFLRNFIRYLNGSSRTVDVSLFGGSKLSGTLSNGFIANNLPKIAFVDQSVTGMFETRTYLERV